MFKVEMETNTEDFDDILQEGGVKIEDKCFYYLISIQTKKEAIPGQIPPVVREFTEYLISLAHETNILLPEKKTDFIKVWHKNHRLYFAIDPNETVLGNVIGEQLYGAFKVFRQYSMDIKVSICSAMTIKSIIETVGAADLGGPVC